MSDILSKVPLKQFSTPYDRTEVTTEGSSDPRDHKVTCNLTVSTNDYEKIKAVLPVEYFDQLETKRELAIMREVMTSPGRGIIEKVDNTLDRWSHEKQTTVRGDVRYKLKYRY